MSELIKTTQENKTASSVFGEGPWPCLNEISDHYSEMLIKTYSLSKTKHSKFTMGIFECNKCGFTYYRKSTQGEFTNHKVRTYGHEWDAKLTELLTVKGLDFYKAAKEMKVERKVFLTNARRLGLSHYCINDIDTDYNMHFLRNVRNEEERFIYRRDKYRSEIREYLSNHPEAKRNDLFNETKVKNVLA